MARIHGILNNASGVRPNTKIVLEAAKTTSDVVIYAPDQTITTDANGAYDFECKPSFYNVTIIQQGFPREKVGIIQVYSDSVDGSLNEFLTNLKPDDLTPEILKDCIDAKVAAEVAAKIAQEESGKVVNATKLGLQVNNLHTTRDAITWKAGLYVEDPSQLYVHDNVEYLPNPKATPFPFTTGATFNADNWVLSSLLTKQFAARGLKYTSSTIGADLNDIKILFNNDKMWFFWDVPSGTFSNFVDNGNGTGLVNGAFEVVTEEVQELRGRTFTGRDVLTVYPEGFQCIDYYKDTAADNYDNLVKMLRFINPHPIEFTDYADLSVSLNSTQREVMLTGLYRYTKPLDIPSGILLRQATYTSFSTQTKTGLYYDANDLNTYAISTLFYKADGGKYIIDKNPMTIATGAEIDSGTYYHGCKNTELSCAVITKPQVLLGARLCSAGLKTTNLSIGEQTDNLQTDAAKMPKVAVHMFGSWGSYHQTPQTLSRVQGWVSSNANGSAVVNGAYINRNGVQGGLAEVPVFDVPEFTGAGSMGIVNISTATEFINPTVEHWSNPYVQYGGGIAMSAPHIEGQNAEINYPFTVIKGSLDVILAGSAPHIQEPTAACFWLQGLVQDQHSINISGIFPTLGYTLLNGTATGSCVTIDAANNAQFQYGKLGKTDFVKELINFSQRDVFVSSTGSDNNWGLHQSAPLKTLKYAPRLANWIKSPRVQLIDVITQSDVCGCPLNVDFVGAGGVHFTGNAYMQFDNTTDISILNTGEWKADNQALFRVAGFKHVNVTSTSKLKSNYSLFNFAAPSSVNFVQFGGSISGISVYANATSTINAEISLNVKTASRPTGAETNPSVNGVLTKFKSFGD